MNDLPNCVTLPHRETHLDSSIPMVVPAPVEILFKRLLVSAIMPKQGSPQAAGFDLVSTSATKDPSFMGVVVGTGLATAFPPGYVLKIFPRSGLAFKHGIRLVNGVGIIDADYRGEIKLGFVSDAIGVETMRRLLKPGTRVAQAILEKLPTTTWVEHTGELPETVRGTGGFGSTGLS